MDQSCCTASEMLLWSFLMAWAKSVVKVFLFNCLPEPSYTTVFPNSRHPPSKAMTAFTIVSSARSEVQVIIIIIIIIIIYENYYIQWLLLLFIGIFSASLSGSGNFVLFDSLDGTGVYSQMIYVIFQCCA